MYSPPNEKKVILDAIKANWQRFSDSYMAFLISRDHPDFKEITTSKIAYFRRQLGLIREKDTSQLHQLKSGLPRRTHDKWY